MLQNYRLFTKLHNFDKIADQIQNCYKITEFSQNYRILTKLQNLDKIAEFVQYFFKWADPYQKVDQKTTPYYFDFFGLKHVN